MRAGAIKPPGVHYSPSQLVTFEACPRKHAFDTIWGYREEEGEAAAWGTEGHSFVELCLKGARPLDLGLRDGVALRMTRYYEDCLAPFLTAHGSPELHIEHQVTAPFEVDGVGRFWWTFLDLSFVAEGEFEGQRYGAVVLDHKTHRSMRWAKSRWELERDLQMLTCAKFSPAQADNVLLVLGQVQREGAVEHQLTRAVVTRSTIEDTWRERALPIVREIEQVRRSASFPGDVRTPPEGPGNASACKAFGGCPYLDACKLAEAGRADWEAPIAHLRKDAVQYLNPPDSTRRPEGSPWHVVHNEEEKLTQALEGSVKGTEVKVNFLDELVNKAKNAETVPAPVPKEEIAAEEVTGPVTPPKRGRPKGSKNKATVTEIAQEVREAVNAPALKPPLTPDQVIDAMKQEVAAVLTSEKRAEFVAGVTAHMREEIECTLFIDCVPCEGHDGPVVHFSEFIAPVLRELATLKLDGQGRPAENGGTYKDWRMIPYGQGGAYVRIALESCPLPEALIVETRDPLVNEVLATIRVRATRVIQGVR